VAQYKRADMDTNPYRFFTLQEIAPPENIVSFAVTQSFRIGFGAAKSRTQCVNEGFGEHGDIIYLVIIYIERRKYLLCFKKNDEIY